jgi:hypothetical protein
MSNDIPPETTLDRTHPQCRNPPDHATLPPDDKTSYTDGYAENNNSPTQITLLKQALFATKDA